jgi:hypothetical protein
MEGQGHESKKENNQQYDIILALRLKRTEETNNPGRRKARLAMVEQRRPLFLVQPPPITATRVQGGWYIYGRGKRLRFLGPTEG